MQKWVTTSNPNWRVAVKMVPPEKCIQGISTFLKMSLDSDTPPPSGVQATDQRLATLADRQKNFTKS